MDAEIPRKKWRYRPGGRFIVGQPTGEPDGRIDVVSRREHARRRPQGAPRNLSLAAHRHLRPGNRHGGVTNMSDEKPDIRMLVSVERDRTYPSDYVYVVGRPVRIEVDEQGREHVRNLNGDSFRVEPLADLQVRCYVNDGDGEYWGYTREYREVFSVDEQRARAMVKTLSKIQRGMERLEREFGFAESFAQYLARVASVLGISRFGFVARAGNGMWHDGNEHRWVDASYLRDMIANQVADKQKAGTR